jgi:predicted dithiol-disulfide oxidoreductase (DUF899 family)
MANRPPAAHKVVSHDEWVEARKKHLIEEKKFTRQRDLLSQARRELPWVSVENEYVFEGPKGRLTLAELFDGRRQLVVYHAMFDPASASDRTPWTQDAACPICSFWLDNLNGMVVHLKHREVTPIAVSRAPYPKIEAYRKRMGWAFDWYSSGASDFNRDFGVSFTRVEIDSKTPRYNYGTAAASFTEFPGISVFIKDDAGRVFHTYSTYARGLDMLNLTYHYLDLMPLGRSEDASRGPGWIRRHDEYDE